MSTQQEMRIDKLNDRVEELETAMEEFTVKMKTKNKQKINLDNYIRINISLKHTKEV